MFSRSKKPVPVPPPRVDSAKDGEEDIVESYVDDDNHVHVRKEKSYVVLSKAIYQTGREAGATQLGFVDLVFGMRGLYKRSTIPYLNAPPPVVVSDVDLLRTLQHYLIYVECSYAKDFGDLVAEEGTGFNQETDVIHTEFHAVTNRPAFYVALDRSRKKVVLAIRGTASFRDAMTDAMGAPAVFLSHYAHMGIAWAAQWFFINIKALLLKLLADNPGYGLIVTGHSLGAGTSCALTALLNDDHAKTGSFPDLHCYAFAPPPVFTRELATTCTRTTSVILDFDCVSRMSPPNAKKAIADVKAVSDEWRASVSERIRKSQVAKFSRAVAESDTMKSVGKGVDAVSESLSKLWQSDSAVSARSSLTGAVSSASGYLKGVFTGGGSSSEGEGSGAGAGAAPAPAPALATAPADKAEDEAETVPPKIVCGVEVTNESPTLKVLKDGTGLTFQPPGQVYHIRRIVTEEQRAALEAAAKAAGDDLDADDEEGDGEGEAESGGRFSRFSPSAIRAAIKTRSDTTKSAPPPPAPSTVLPAPDADHVVVPVADPCSTFDHIDINGRMAQDHLSGEYKVALDSALKRLGK